MAKILCQSIRYFCGDVPIYLLKDGEINTHQIEQLGNIFHFDETSLPKSIRQLNGFYSKIKVFFGTNYDRFLFLDADTVLINNILQLPFLSCDFYVNLTIDNLNDQETRNRVSYLVFDVEKLKNFDPEFHDPIITTFNSGQFFAQTGLLPEDLVIRCVEVSSPKNNNGPIFKFGDQGILNYIFNKGKKLGWFRTGGSNFTIFPSWEPPGKFPSLSLETLRSGSFKERSLIHFTTPARKFRLRDHDYSFVLEEFYRQYYAKYPPYQRFLDQILIEKNRYRPRIRKLLRL